MPYRGAISVPNIRGRKNSSSSDESNESRPKKDTKVVDQPLRYTSKVTAIIKHTTAKTSEEPKAKPPSPIRTKVSPRSYSEAGPQQTKPTSTYTRPTNAPALSASSNVSRPRSQSPPSNSSSYSSQASVVMRRQNAGVNRNK